MNFKPTITKEEINELPVALFDGKIIVVDNKSSFKKAIFDLKKQKIVGFDTETKPSFAKGVSHKVALIQIATEKVCYLFRLNLIGIPLELEKFLGNKSIKKIGLSLHDDMLALNKRARIYPENFIDLQKIVADYGIEEMSLQKMYALIFKKKISKTQRLSNWEAAELSEAQMHYAAMDAWACREIYLHLLPLKKIKTQPSLPNNIPVFN